VGIGTLRSLVGPRSQNKDPPEEYNSGTGGRAARLGAVFFRATAKTKVGREQRGQLGPGRWPFWVGFLPGENNSMTSEGLINTRKYWFNETQKIL